LSSVLLLPYARGAQIALKHVFAFC